MKCLPQSKLSLAKGNVVHDWHAEVLAIRAFNRWLVDECADLARKGSGSVGEWVRWRDAGRQGRPIINCQVQGQQSKNDGQDVRHGVGWQDQPFEMREDVRIHMYCSGAPCGDASMELTMAEQEVATPWSSQLDTLDGMPGRGYFDQLGIVRRKPSRPDAPPTLSKSCSDKLAMKQCTSLLSGVVSLLVHPGNAYLRTLVLPEQQCVPHAVERAFGRKGRMSVVATEGLYESWHNTGYTFQPFDVKTTNTEFEYRKCGGSSTPASNLSVVFTPSRQEILINGVLQGRKQFDSKGASCVSRRKLSLAVLDIVEAVGHQPLKSTLSTKTYAGVKNSCPLASRERVKRQVRESALQGWKRNIGDENWTLDHL